MPLLFFTLRLEVARGDRKRCTHWRRRKWRSVEWIVCFALYAFRRGNRRQVEIIGGRSCGPLANERSLFLFSSGQWEKGWKGRGKEWRGGKGGRRAGRKVKILEVAAWLVQISSSQLGIPELSFSRKSISRDPRRWKIWWTLFSPPSSPPTLWNATALDFLGEPS